MVLDQLRYLGMLDIIRIRREGYPVHLDFTTFVQAYRHLVRGIRLPPPYAKEGAVKEAATAILNRLGYPRAEWQVKNRLQPIGAVFDSFSCCRCCCRAVSGCLTRPILKRFTQPVSICLIGRFQVDLAGCESVSLLGRFRLYDGCIRI